MGGILVDTHTHYSHKRFDCGRDEIISHLSSANVMAVVEGAINFESNQKMKVLCEKYPNVYMAIGCHPNCVEEMDEDKLSQLIELASHHKAIAIGETGLDYARGKTNLQIQKQKEWFAKFISLAISMDKPLVIHCREAYEDLIKILSGYKFLGRPGVIHCFSGNKEQANRLLNMGFYIGVNGMFTQMDTDSDVCAAIKDIPLDRILLETDAPYLVPKGAEGKRNTSLNLSCVTDALAGLRNEPAEQIREVILQNTERVYPQIFEGINQSVL